MGKDESWNFWKLPEQVVWLCREIESNLMLPFLVKQEAYRHHGPLELLMFTNKILESSGTCWPWPAPLSLALRNHLVTVN
jgi:hypothetical protein